ncbi:MAG: anti-sigma F factor [Clostridia bacterium]|nr:anti-sigma F factor [Clostridia bacterium]
MVNEMRLDFWSRPENEALSRMAISAFIMPVNPTLEQLGDVKTAVSEAVTNAIVHGYGGGPGLVRLRALLDEAGGLTVEVVDKGRGIENVERARQPFFTTMEDSERSGMGFTVMESFMDGVEVISQVNNGTMVRMRKRLSPACCLVREA